MPSLTDRQKKLLLEIARRAMSAAVEGKAPQENLAEEEDVRQPGGAFVTLHRSSRLRGCIGQLPGNEPLVEVVAHCARLAALEDPRFRPVRPAELAGIQIEISVLSVPENIAPENIVPGKHGLLVSRGWERGVLLPQVATQFGWSGLRFMEETCVKAGLEPHAWKDSGTRVQAFTAEVFSEAEFGAREAPKESYSIST
jgi:AmmeMemoRadiSam system protein A